jgi:hypothetical protein
MRHLCCLSSPPKYGEICWFQSNLSACMAGRKVEESYLFLILTFHLKEKVGLSGPRMFPSRTCIQYHSPHSSSSSSVVSLNCNRVSMECFYKRGGAENVRRLFHFIFSFIPFCISMRGFDQMWLINSEFFFHPQSLHVQSISRWAPASIGPYSQVMTRIYETKSFMI